MKNVLFILREAKDNILNKIKTLSKPKRILFYIFVPLVVVLSVPSSYFYGNVVCRHFAYIGAIDKAPATFYTVFTVYTVVFNIFNGSYYILTKVPTSNSRKKQRVLSRLVPLYLYNFALAVYFVCIPLITYANYTEIFIFRIIVVFLCSFVFPLLPMALSAPFVFLLPKIKNKKLTRAFNILLFVLFLAIFSVYGSTLLEKLSDNAYTLSMAFTKYYFPASILEIYLSSGSGMAIFTATNLAAFYLSILAILKYNKL